MIGGQTVLAAINGLKYDSFIQQQIPDTNHEIQIYILPKNNFMNMNDRWVKNDLL
jgi:hypothetical protein